MVTAGGLAPPVWPEKTFFRTSLIATQNAIFWQSVISFTPWPETYDRGDSLATDQKRRARLRPLGDTVPDPEPGDQRPELQRSGRWDAAAGRCGGSRSSSGGRD